MTHPTDPDTTLREKIMRSDVYEVMTTDNYIVKGDIAIDEILALIRSEQLALLDRLEEKVNGQYTDVEATEKHLEGLLTGDELEMRVLDMKIDADDTADTLKPITKAIAAERTRIEGGEK